MIRCRDLDWLHYLPHRIRGESLHKEEGFIFALYTLVHSARECRAKTVHHCLFWHSTTQSLEYTLDYRKKSPLKSLKPEVSFQKGLSILFPVLFLSSPLRSNRYTNPGTTQAPKFTPSSLVVGDPSPPTHIPHQQSQCAAHQEP